MEGEKLAVFSPEALQKPLFQAELVHASWYSERDPKHIGLSHRGRFGIRAAALLHDQGKGTGYIVLTAGKIWGEGYPSLATLMKEELVNRLKIDPNKVILSKEELGEEALDTSGEIDLFLKIAQKRGWNSLADVASRQHQRWTIPELYRQKGVEEPRLLSAESLITQGGDPRLAKIVKKFGNSRYEKAYIVYEGIKRAILMIDPDYKLLGRVAGATRQKKRPFRLLPGLPVDKLEIH